MSRSLARYLASVALILAAIVSARRAEAKSTTLGEATAGELATQSRPTAKASPPAQPHSRAKARSEHRAAPTAKHTSAKAKAHPIAKPRPEKPKPDQRVKANAAKPKPKAKHAPVRPSIAPAKPAGKPPIARA